MTQPKASHPPRITIMNRLFWPKRFGGLERVLWQYANALADAGAHIHVICEQHDDAPASEQAREGLTVQRHAPVEFGRLWRVGELVQARWWKQALAKAPTSDIIWANEPTAATAVIRSGLAGRLLYRPVFCYDGLTHAARTIPAMAPLARTFLARKLDRYAYKHAAYVIDESHNLLEQHHHYYGPRANTTVIPNPASISEPTTCLRQRFGLTPEQFVIGFVGRPGDPCKDLPFLIEAVRSQAMPDHARLLLVGGGSGFETAKQWVNDAGLAPHTIWTGDLEDPSPAYAAMNALVLPSRFETFGNVIVEAHAHGLPALARAADFTATPPVYTASRELIDNGVTGYVVDPHDPAELGARLLLMAANPAMAGEMGRVARQRAASYTWADVAGRYLQALGLEQSQALPARRAA
ncbi:MAG: glycosyltransferase family 4 protein [Phycisphaeraceae bacterium]|nr:glycosyltransferase family 4 protein [Phycisphaeraceae bacterium]